MSTIFCDVLKAGALCSAVLFAPLSYAGEVDFSGQRVEVIVPFAEGGGADTYTRIVTRYLGAALPGSPTVTVRNIPGGGTINGVNQFTQQARPDGLTVLTVSISTLLTYALTPSDSRINFDPATWVPIISSPLGSVVYIAGGLGVEDAYGLDDLEGRELFIGLQSPTGSEIRTVMALDLLGVNVRPVSGMDGGQAHLAFERGEFHFNSDTAAAYVQMAMPLVEDGRAIPLFTFGFADENGEIVRDPAFPELPHFLELYEDIHGTPLSGAPREAWDALFFIGVMNSKALVLPEGTSPEILDTYIGAVETILANPEFQDLAKNDIGVYPQSLGDAAKTSLDNAFYIGPEARTWLAGWMRETFDVTIDEVAP